MGKNIIFCADGTWNAPGAEDGGNTEADTNVFKLFSNLDSNSPPAADPDAKEQERTLTAPDGTVLQVAKYLHGVGDSNNLLVKVLGGTLGAGLTERILRGYTFVSRNYAAGDKIFLVGFSRGAYTARALAGLINAKGLLSATKLGLGDKVDGYRYAIGAWYDFLRARLEARVGLLSRLDAFVGEIPTFLGFKASVHADEYMQAPIEAVAVWDTVGALGIPAYNANLMRVDVFQFADLKLSAGVRNGLHAVAVDEQRKDFEPTLWEPDSRVTQVLFVGSHGDVGGGYPEHTQSDAALKWMTGRLTRLGVQFSATPTFVPKPDPKGPAHLQWKRPPWDRLLHSPRNFPAGLALSRSLVDRLAAGDVVADFGGAASAYAPGNLATYISGKAAAAGVTVVEA
jgi:type VI secretion system (T6SS) phospholipase Tle1-like effector